MSTNHLELSFWVAICRYDQLCRNSCYDEHGCNSHRSCCYGQISCNVMTKLVVTFTIVSYLFRRKSVVVFCWLVGYKYLFKSVLVFTISIQMNHQIFLITIQGSGTDYTFICSKSVPKKWNLFYVTWKKIAFSNSCWTSRNFIF